MSSIFPFTGTAQPDVNVISELPVLKEMAYDFEHNKLLRNGGRTYLVEKDEALKIWIFKALKTKRFVYPAYTHAYGTEMDKVVGENNHPDIVDSELKRYITETLMVNPYIQELSDFSFKHIGSGVAVSFIVTSLYGRFCYDSEVYNE